MPRVALETTLLLHGVPTEISSSLDAELRSIIHEAGGKPALTGVMNGVARTDLTPDDLSDLLARESVPKLNNSNLGIALTRGESGATTVGSTMELAAGDNVRFFATGGLGGVHPNLHEHLDISGDLLALTRFPVAVITSGTKSILDVAATRELLETLGIPVVGYQTDEFPAFYRRSMDPPVHLDGRFDDVETLARFCRAELARTGRGVVVCNPIPVEHEIRADDWEDWLARAQRTVDRTTGRDVTPALLASLHRISSGATIEANLHLVRSNVSLAARLATVPFEQ